MQPDPSDSDNSVSSWRPAQAYTFAIICLVIGLPIGYLIRGSTVPTTGPATVSASTTGQAASVLSHKSNAGAAPAAMPSIDDMKRMANKQVAPVLAELEKKPNDPVL